MPCGSGDWTRPAAVDVHVDDILFFIVIFPLLPAAHGRGYGSNHQLAAVVQLVLSDVNLRLLAPI